MVALVHDRVGFDNSAFNAGNSFLISRARSLDPSLADQPAAVDALFQRRQVSQAAIDKTRTPLPHQELAVSKVVDGFTRHRRGKLILPCGAGKTYTSLQIKERMKAKRTLVLVPYLHLIRQFRNEWDSHRKTAYRCLTVCSEKEKKGQHNPDGLDSDLMAVDEEDLRLTSTEPKDIAAFLMNDDDGENDDRVVFATYNSSPQIEAAMKIVKATEGGNPKFNLALMDEGHKTVSKDGTFNTVIHDDKKIPVENRLYMTATPRVLTDDLEELDTERPEKSIIDMNDEKRYGPTFHEMKLEDAIKQCILTDYRILVMGVSDDDINTFLQAHPKSLKDPPESYMKNIALYKVMQKYGLSRAMSFHNQVHISKAFARRHKELLPGMNCFHVDGSIPASEREKVFHSFSQTSTSRKAMMSNPRCLGLGLDIQGADLAYFPEKKTGDIDIVQSVGRVTRKDPLNPDKLGYVVLPIHVNEGKAIDSDENQASLETLMRVLVALGLQDERLLKDLSGHLQVDLAGDYLQQSFNSWLNFNAAPKIKRISIRTFDDAYRRIREFMGEKRPRDLDRLFNELIPKQLLLSRKNLVRLAVDAEKAVPEIDDEKLADLFWKPEAAMKFENFTALKNFILIDSKMKQIFPNRPRNAAGFFRVLRRRVGIGFDEARALAVQEGLAKPLASELEIMNLIWDAPRNKISAPESDDLQSSSRTSLRFQASSPMKLVAHTFAKDYKTFAQLREDVRADHPQPPTNLTNFFTSYISSRGGPKRAGIIKLMRESGVELPDTKGSTLAAQFWTEEELNSQGDDNHMSIRPFELVADTFAKPYTSFHELRKDVLADHPAEPDNADSFVSGYLRMRGGPNIDGIIRLLKADGIEPPNKRPTTIASYFWNDEADDLPQAA